jgi:hypothetical protein
MADESDIGKDVRTQEAAEILASARSFGSFAGEASGRWLKSWCRDREMPRDDETGAMIWPADLLLHAGAVSAIRKLEADGYGDRFPAELPNGADAEARFFYRLDRDTDALELSTEGATLMSMVGHFYVITFAPATYGSLEPGTHVTLVGSAPDDDGIDCLARLLLDYSDTISHTRLGAEHDS